MKRFYGEVLWQDCINIDCKGAFEFEDKYTYSDGSWIETYKCARCGFKVFKTNMEGD